MQEFYFITIISNSGGQLILWDSTECVNPGLRAVRAAQLAARPGALPRREPFAPTARAHPQPIAPHRSSLDLRRQHDTVSRVVSAAGLLGAAVLE